jgi:acetoacetyl-CoA synthetase
MPSMPIFFWNDPGGERLRESYFDMYPGVWRHGDWIEITERGTAVIYGRSDSTINRGGIRMGTSEIYRAVLGIEAIVDALVVDVPREGEESWMPLFVVLREDARLDDDLTREIARRVREECSPRHVPSEVLAIAEVPRTLSGKVLEVPVKRILMGTPAEFAASRDWLHNPAAEDGFVEQAGERGHPAGCSDGCFPACGRCRGIGSRDRGHRRVDGPRDSTGRRSAPLVRRGQAPSRKAGGGLRV